MRAAQPHMNAVKASATTGSGAAVEPLPAGTRVLVLRAVHGRAG